MEALLDFWLAKLVALAPLVVGYCQFVTDGQAMDHKRTTAYF